MKLTSFSIRRRPLLPKGGRERKHGRAMMIEALEQRIAPATFFVTNTNDSGTGSLRAAITNANSASGIDLISFNIPGGGPGGGVQTISPLTPLPAINEGVNLDGFTQPGSAPNSHIAGQPDNSVHLIVLDGSLAGTTGNGLSLNSDGSTIRGLVIDNWHTSSALTGNGIQINSANNLIIGNFLGITPDGLGSAANGHADINIIRGSGNKIGDTRPASPFDVPDEAKRNVISGSGQFGIILGNASSQTQVIGNYIGTNKHADAVLGSQLAGVEIDNSGNNTLFFNIVGGSTGAGFLVTGAGAVDNTLVSNTIGRQPGNGALPNGTGVRVEAGALRTVIQSSAIEASVGGGVVIDAASGTMVLGNGIHANGGNGVTIQNGTTGTIVGTIAGDGNEISGNAGSGIYVAAGAANNLNTFRANSIHDNGALGINLVSASDPSNGVTPNDSGDADTGANGLQNFPVVTGITLTPSHITVTATLNSTPSTAFAVDVFSSADANASGYGEGTTYLGSTTATTNSSGIATFSFDADATLASSVKITATASGANGTSEFSLARGTTNVFTWDAGGATDTSWFNPLNWDLDAGTPGAGDTAILNTAATITLASDVSVALFTQSAGTLTGAGKLTALTSFQWSGGTESGTGTTAIPAGATFLLSGAAQKTLSRPLDLTGNTTFTGAGNLAFGSGGSIDNRGAFDIQTDADFVTLTSSTSLFTNEVSGILRKSAGAGVTTAPNSPGSLQLRDSGTIQVQTGTLQWLGDSMHTNGNFIILPGATVELSAFDHQFNGTTAISGGGTLIHRTGSSGLGTAVNVTSAGTTLRIEGVVGVNTLFVGVGARLVLDGVSANIAGSPAIVVDGSFDWVQGPIGSSGSVNIHDIGTLNISGTAAKTATGVAFQNAGTVNIGGPGATTVTAGFSQTAGVTNLFSNIGGGSFGFSGGVLDGVGTISANVTNTGASVQPGSGGPGTITIAGNYTQSGAGILAADIGGTAAGQFDVLSVSGTTTLGGTLSLAHLGGFTPANGNTFRVVASANNPGTFTMLTGATAGKTQTASATGLVISQGAAAAFIWDAGGGGDTSWFNPLNWQFDSGFPGAGDTAILNINSTITLGAADAAVASFQQTTGTLTGSKTLSVTGGFSWSGGTLNLNTKILAGAMLDVFGATAKRLLGDNSGGISLDIAAGANAGWRDAGDIQFENLAIVKNAGTFLVQNSASLIYVGGGNVGQFNHLTGGVFTKTGSGTTSIGANIAFTTAGAVNVNTAGAVIDFNRLNASGGAAFTGPGSSRASNAFSITGATTISNGSALELVTGATLTGSGTFAGTGNFNWSGGTIGAAVTIASGSTMFISGTATKRLFGDNSTPGAAGTINIPQGATVDVTGAGNLQFENLGVVNNSGTFLSESSAALVYVGGGNPGRFNNLATGLFTRSGAGVTAVDSRVTFNQSGRVDAPAGTGFDLPTLNANDGSKFTGAGLIRATGALNLGGVITLDPAVTLELPTGATLTGSGTFAGTGNFNWTGGTIAGVVTIPSGSTMFISGTAAKRLFGDNATPGAAGTINIPQGATVDVTGAGNLQFENLGVVNNSGTFLSESSASLIYVGGGNAGQFNNLATGLFTRSGGGVTSLDSRVTFNQSGRVDAPAGAGFDLPTLNANDGSKFTGAGLVRATGALNIGGTITIDPATTLELPTGATLTGSGTFAGAGNFNWTGGTITGVVTIASGSTALISGTAVKRLLGDNATPGAAGTINIPQGATVDVTGAGNLQFENLGVVNNSGTFLTESSASLIYVGGGNPGRFNNLTGGAFTKPGAGTSSILASVVFTNAGTVNVNTAGAVIDFNQLNASNGAVFKGPGISRASNALAITGTTTILNVGGLEFASGTLTGSGTFAGAGNFNWTGGTISGVVTVASGSTALISGAAVKRLFGDNSTPGVAGAIIIPTGATVDFSGTGNLQFENLGVVNNSGTFHSESSAALVFVGGGNPGQFNNLATGLFTRIGAGTSSIGGSVVFSNAGTVNAQTGALNFAGGYTQTAGSTVLGGGNIGGGGAFAFSGGELRGAGTITGNVNNTGATVRPGGTGAVGLIDVVGTFTQGTGGTLAIEVASAGQFDRVTASGPATIAGTLNAGTIGGFSPAAGTPFQVLTGSTRTGTFGTANGQLAAQYNPTNVTLLAPASSVFNWDAGAGADTSWFNPLNWSPDGVPGASDTAILSINATITLPTSTSVGTFRHNIGQFVGDSTTLNIPAGATLTVLTDFTWTGGTESGAGTLTVAAGATFTYPDGSPTFLTQRTLNLLGTSTFSNASLDTLTLANGATINNSGVLDLRNGLSLPGSGTFHNLAGGTVKGTTSNTFLVTGNNVAFTNAGTVRAEAGTLGFNGGYVQTAGSSQMVGGILNIAGFLQLQGGEFAGVGAYAGSINNTGGVVRPGGAGVIGTLTTNGGYIQTAAGTLETEIAGTAPGQYDVFAPGGTPQVAGTLSAPLLGGFTPVAGNQFPVIGHNVIGTFAATPAGFTTQYNPGNVTLLATAGGPTPFVVTTASDVVNASDGVTSLREAIIAANNTTGTDTITFAIPGAGVKTIALTSVLPNITDPLIIDGFTQAGASANTNGLGLPDNSVHLIVIDGTGAGTGPSQHGLLISAGSSTVRGLVIDGFGGSGILLQTRGGNAIEGNFIGVNAGGSAAAGNGVNGVSISGVGTNVIGGTLPAARNVISGNAGGGVDLQAAGATANLVQGNFIGTDATGLRDLGNVASGVQIFSVSGNTIGGTASGARNVISGNDFDGVLISGATATGNFVLGNFVGTDVAGVRALGNASSGIVIDGASGNQIGDGTAAGRNVAAANGTASVGDIHNGAGVLVFNAGANSNVISGNYLGTNATGLVALGNIKAGLAIYDNASGNTVNANVIAGNNSHGLDLAFGASTNTATANLIGVGADRTTALGNGGAGVLLNFNASNNTIGGSASALGNIIAHNTPGIAIANGSTANKIYANTISGNTGIGVSVDDSAGTSIGLASIPNVIIDNTGAGITLNGAATTGTLVQGNFVGVTPSSFAGGTAAHPNGGAGLAILNGATGTDVGGTSVGNIFAGNSGDGVLIDHADGNLVRGNRIGQVGLSTGFFPNGGAGVTVSDSLNVRIGSPATSELNLIAHNAGAGIKITGTSTVTARGNIVESNGGLGLDLAGNGVTANDAGDSDTGPNSLLNFPTLVQIARTTGGSGYNYAVDGTYNGAPNTTVTVDLYANTVADASGFGEAQFLIHSFSVTTNSAGAGTFSGTFSTATTNVFGSPLGSVFTTQATLGNGASGPSSEFSAAVSLNAPPASQQVFFLAQGLGSHVESRKASNGALVRSFAAFNPNFSGGVSIAGGDVNGDGINDVIVGSGDGGGGRVRVFDGRQVSGGRPVLLYDLFPFGNAYRGGINVAAGDFDGDGRADFVVAPSAGANSEVLIFSGATGSLLTSFLAYGRAYGGVRVAVGDINGDGAPDIITGTGSGSNVRVFDGHNPATKLRDFNAFPSTFRGGVTVAAGDVNHDGVDDIIVGAGSGSSLARIFLSGSPGSVVQFDAFPGIARGISIATVDANGDGVADIIAARGRFAAPEVRIYDGNSVLTGSPRTLVKLTSSVFDPTYVGGLSVG